MTRENCTHTFDIGQLFTTSVAKMGRVYCHLYKESTLEQCAELYQKSFKKHSQCHEDSKFIKSIDRKVVSIEDIHTDGQENRQMDNPQMH